MVEKKSTFKIVVLGEGMHLLLIDKDILLNLLICICYDTLITFHKERLIKSVYICNQRSLIFIARVGKTSLTLRFCKGNFDEK